MDEILHFPLLINVTWTMLCEERRRKAIGKLFALEVNVQTNIGNVENWRFINQDWREFQEAISESSWPNALEGGRNTKV